MTVLLGCTPGGSRHGAGLDAGIAAPADRDATSAVPAPPDAAAASPPAPLPGDILDTTLAMNLDTNGATATLTLVPSTEPQSFEVGDLEIRNVHHAGGSLTWSRQGTSVEVRLPAADAPVSVSFEYTWRSQPGLNGIPPTGWLYTWPYWCGNAFPCRSAPSEGSTFHVALSGRNALPPYPREIPSDSPSYMLGWGRRVEYVRAALGTTDAGTRVHTWHEPNTEALADPVYLAAAFDWLERNLGRYRFGGEVGSVTAPWGSQGTGGIETHPYWQIGRAEWSDESLHVHEAAHGWFGNGVRLSCWEDFVLSEGTASYLAARVLEAVGAAALAAELWSKYETEFSDPAIQNGNAWPESRCQIDILDPELALPSRIPYVKGALFLRALETRVGRTVFDSGLRTFYARWAGKAASMQDLLDVLQEASGYDAAACAQSWLRGRGTAAYDCP